MKVLKGYAVVMSFSHPFFYFFSSTQTLHLINISFA